MSSRRASQAEFRLVSTPPPNVESGETPSILTSAKDDRRPSTSCIRGGQTSICTVCITAWPEPCDEFSCNLANIKTPLHNLGVSHVSAPCLKEQRKMRPRSKRFGEDGKSGSRRQVVTADTRQRGPGSTGCRPDGRYLALCMPVHLGSLPTPCSPADQQNTLAMPGYLDPGC